MKQEETIGAEATIITINNLPWIIETATKGSEILKIDGNECLAVTIFPEMKIVINDSLERTLMRQTLIHELTHAVIFSYGHHVEYDEEAVCNFIGSHLDEINCFANMLLRELPQNIRKHPDLFDVIKNYGIDIPKISKEVLLNGK